MARQLSRYCPRRSAIDGFSLDRPCHWDFTYWRWRHGPGNAKTCRNFIGLTTCLNCLPPHSVLIVTHSHHQQEKNCDVPKRRIAKDMDTPLDLVVFMCTSDDMDNRITKWDMPWKNSERFDIHSYQQIECVHSHEDSSFHLPIKEDVPSGEPLKFSTGCTTN